MGYWREKIITTNLQSTVKSFKKGKSQKNFDTSRKEENKNK